MREAHLVQRGQVPGQVRSKVLRDFGQVGDILRSTDAGVSTRTSPNILSLIISLKQRSATDPQLIQKHDHPVFVVFDEGVHALHVGLLFGHKSVRIKHD